MRLLHFFNGISRCDKLSWFLKGSTGLSSLEARFIISMVFLASYSRACLSAMVAIYLRPRVTIFNIQRQRHKRDSTSTWTGLLLRSRGKIKNGNTLITSFEFVHFWVTTNIYKIVHMYYFTNLSSLWWGESLRQYQLFDTRTAGIRIRWVVHILNTT